MSENRQNLLASQELIIITMVTIHFSQKYFLMDFQLKQTKCTENNLDLCRDSRSGHIKLQRKFDGSNLSKLWVNLAVAEKFRA